ncbi:LytTR family DNA-binding domain-containing protein [Chitinophaga pendula]|uniref:LytR/AlgR family response regulator transcription factor n=1 Tax=Chitinophaga TaxID=79328 RepID=UPI000BAFAEF1|nr:MULTISPECIES: LytTR family DNA-binding domain-containing protein [Chitinophaga]ASZ12588.1 DNA-binding response regulator [Chitinophaga sp. MD30]UCJ09809.1 LytTR family DNA-binding domain-containing protein [Chitinophaga pendula]
MKVIKKILIMEDEEPNAERLQRFLSEIRPVIEVSAILDSVKKAVEWLAKNDPPDLIIMDIRLADGLCFQIFNLANVKSPVIFTTAYDEYAIKAFKYNSLDYLLKPIEREELETAILKYEDLIKHTFEQHTLIENLLNYIQPKEYRTRFLIPYRDGYKKINVEDIAFFSSQVGGNYANLFNGETMVIPQTLETLEQQLDPALFFRANRQYIVHIDSVEKVYNQFNGKLKIEIKNYRDTDIIVSRSKAPLLKMWLDY